MNGDNKGVVIIWLVIILLTGVLIYISLPKSAIEIYKNVGNGINPAKGNSDSSTIIIEFSDFQCPACKASLPIINEILNEQNVVFYYRNFPLTIHENSFIAAEAAECANEQGKFWQYHDILFENQNKLDKESLKLYAIQIELNKEQFNSCLDSEKYKYEVERDLNDGKMLDVQGTPTFFINGRKVFGANKELIKNIIEEESEK